MSARSMRRARARELQRQAKRDRRIGVRSKAAAGAGAALGATVVFAPAAEAATFTVTNLNNAGAGSLRQAVIDANQLDGDDVVVFQTGLSGTITLTGVDSDIEIYYDGIDIQGPGASQITVDGNDLDRIFLAGNFDEPNEAVRIAGLTLAGGSTPGGSSGGLGGALYTDTFGDEPPEVTVADAVLTGNTALYGGGAIWTDGGSVTILNSTLTNNQALDGDGGGLYTNSTDGDPGAEVVLRGSSFSGNTASDDGGAINVQGASGDIVIEDTTISGNQAGDNGGGARLYYDFSDITIRNSTFAGNSAVGGSATGGGLALFGEQEIGVTTIDATTFSGNRSGGRGGGAALFGTTGPVAVTNTTVSGNVADADNDGAGYGGGLLFYSFLDAQTPRSLRNSTVVGNSAADAGGVFHHGEDDPAATGDDLLDVSSTIVANNTASDTGPDLGQDAADSDPFVIGFSLIENTAGANVTESPPGSNLLGIDPLLGPLADNGGPTQTQLPAPTSPALDHGIANGLGTDQRALARTFDASNIANGAGSDATDIGAVELSAEGTCKGKAATVLFAPGQKILGSGAKDVVVGTDAKDKIATKGGKDTVCAGKGNDNVKGGGGKDTLLGQGGKDTLKGQGGKDKLKGGAGKDKLRGGPGKDKLSGGGGKDSEQQ